MYIQLTPMRKVALIIGSLTLSLACLLSLISLRGINFKDSFMLLPDVNIYFPKSPEFMNYLMIAFVIGLLPYTVIVIINDIYIDNIRKNVPIVLRELVEGLRSGLTMPQAVERVGRRRKDPLSRILRQVALLMSLGMPFDEAIERAAKKVRIPLIHRIVTTLKLAYMSGGKAVEVLETAASIYSSLWAYENERRASIREYVLIVYISIVVMVLVSFMIVNFFLKSFAETIARSTTIPGMPTITGFLILGVYDCLLKIACIIEAIFGGLIAGKMSRGKLSSGVPHMFFLLLIAVIEWNMLHIIGGFLRGFLGT